MACTTVTAAGQPLGMTHNINTELTSQELSKGLRIPLSCTLGQTLMRGKKIHMEHNAGCSFRDDFIDEHPWDYGTVVSAEIRESP